MVEYRRQEGSRFVVDLGSVKLDALREKQVETEIRGVVLEALAGSPVALTRLPNWIFNQFPGRTLGLWLDPDQSPWPDPGGPLNVADHTLIVREMMTYPFHVLRALRLSKGDPIPSGSEILEAMLDIDVVAPFVKERIKQMVKVLEKIEPHLAKPSREQKQTVAYVEKLIGGRPLAEQVRILRDPSKRTDKGLNGGQDWLQQLLEWIAKMLEDGELSIYSPDFSFHRLLASGTAGSGVASGTAGSGQVIARDATGNIKDADAGGAVAGGFIGTVILPVVGTSGGAAATAGGASLGQALVELVAWLF